MQVKKYNNIHIIGCGTIGSSLAVDIYKANICNVLTLYDYDVIDKVEYPFNENFISLYKVDSLFFILTLLHRDCLIQTYKDAVTSDICVGDTDIIIDCRDLKKPAIKSNICACVDSSKLLLIINNTDVEFGEYNHYIYKKESNMGIKCSNIILNYINNHFDLNNKQCVKYLFDI